jgi:hypothetical protein
MIKRRDFLKNTFGLGIGLVLWPKSLKDILEILSADGSESINLRMPNQIGILTPKDCYVLWGYYKFLGQYWDTFRYSNISNFKEFSVIMNLKTSLIPSYLFEYNSAISVLKNSRKKNHFINYETFLLKNADEYSKKFISFEFFNLNISTGGFKKFGFKNYSGYSGCRFDNPAHIPYRV